VDRTAATEKSLVRVALVDCGGLLGDIIRQAVAAEPDFEVVADIATDGVGPALEGGADVLIWNNADESEVADRLDRIASRCGVRVLATHGDGRMAAVWEIAPRRSALESLSPSAIVELIRASVRGEERA
jgi:DNA-binding NarL/FixJ family response regulator